MHVVIGAGSVGSAVAGQLIAAGENVTVVTRSGRPVEGAASIAADASSLDALLAAAPAATAVYNCANPRYHEWARDWPPIADALLHYAEATGAVLSTCSNLYGYGPVSAPMTESTPLDATGTKGRIRAQMWLDAQRWNDEGRIRATEVRGSDYIAPSDQTLVSSPRVVPRILAGKSVSLIGGLDYPHTWTSPIDMARLMITCAADERAWGSAWHTPSNAPRTQREVIGDIAAAAGVPDVKVSKVPGAALWALGLVQPVMREFRETAYQFEGPFVMDDSAARTTFGMEPTPWPALLEGVVAAYR